jgi:hypothetical protein
MIIGHSDSRSENVLVSTISAPPQNKQHELFMACGCVSDNKSLFPLRNVENL